MATAGRRLYLSHDRTRLVEEGDPDAATLYAAPGDEISAEDMQRFGVTEAKAVEAEAVEDKEVERTEDKAVKRARG